MNFGQTMIEVIVALTLIILFLSGIVVIELYALRNSEYSRKKSIATQLARQQLERARVVRDSAGISSLNNYCFLSSCYINGNLTPVPVTPTGTFGQSLTISDALTGDCPIPDVTITPAPISYKAKAYINWSQGATDITPAPEIEVSTCITDWR